MFKLKLKHKFRNLSIKNKIVILIGLIFFFVFIVNISYFPAHEEERITEFIQNKAQNTMQILSSTVSLALGEQNYEYANNLFSILRNDSSIVYIGLLDESGSVINVSSVQDINLPALDTFTSNTFFEENNILHTSRKIRIDEGLYGYLVIGFSVAERDQQISKVWQLGLWVNIGILFLTILFYLYLNHLITKPLIKFVKTIKHIAQTKDYSQVIEARNTDEIGMLVDAFNTLNGKVYSQTEELLQSRAQLSAILETIGEGAITINEDGNIVLVNQECLNIFGYKREELIGKSILILIPKQYHAAHIKGWEQFKRTGTSSIIGKRREFKGIRSDNTLFPLEVKIVETRVGVNRFITGSIRDITGRKLAEAELKKHQLHLEQLVEERTVELRESEEKFRNLAENSPNMIYINQKGKVVYANKLCEEITGYSKEEFYSPDFDFRVFIEPEYWTSIMENFKKHMEGKEVSPIDSAIRTKTGGRIESIMNTKLITYGGGVAILGIVTDITERKRSEEAIKESERRLRELNATKDKFFSIIAHDLRAPFQALLSISDFFANDIENLTEEEIKDFATDLKKSAESLYDLLNNLLDWSRIQTGKMKYEPIKIKLKEVVDRVVHLLTTNAHNKHIALTTNVNEDLIVYADQNMLHSIVQNLVSNAIKFTDEGGEVKVISYIKDNYTEVAVADNGVGMDEKTLERLFGIDTHITTLGTKNEKGTGLGLILCKELIEKCGGKIWVESELNKGTIFHFTLKKQNGFHRN